MRYYTVLRRFFVSAMLLTTVLALPGCMGGGLFSADSSAADAVPAYARNEKAEQAVRAALAALGDSAAGLTVYAWQDTAFIIGEADDDTFAQVVREARRAPEISAVAGYVFPPAGDAADVHDNALAGRVMDALSGVEGLDISALVVDTVRGDAVLMGPVPSGAGAAQAVAAARAVEGVGQVRSFLHVQDGMRRD
jgi:osmotically-inducible protein OsmY